MTDTVIKLCWEIDSRGRNVRCRDWRGCQPRSWYSLHDNQYCRQQTLWLIFECIEYIDGKYVSVGWPPEDKGETGYNDTLVQHSQPSTAGFTRPIQEIAEVIKRLERTGKDGQNLLLWVKRGELYRDCFSQEAKNALNYCVGWKRKSLEYVTWLKQRNYRRK
jgi:hypothetical protein